MLIKTKKRLCFFLFPPICVGALPYGHFWFWKMKVRKKNVGRAKLLINFRRKQQIKSC